MIERDPSDNYQGGIKLPPPTTPRPSAKDVPPQSPPRVGRPDGLFLQFERGKLEVKFSRPPEPDELDTVITAIRLTWGMRRDGNGGRR